MRTDTEEGTRELLQRACDRNSPIDVFTSAHEPVGRSRLLALRDDGLLIDRPIRDGRPVSVSLGMRISAYLLHDGQRMGFRARILDRSRVQLNTHVSLDALVLSPPSRVEPTQRRGHYRVSLAAESQVTCWLSRIPQPDQDAGPEVAEPAGDGSHLEGSGQAGLSLPPESFLEAEDEPERWEHGLQEIPPMPVQPVNLSIGGLAVAYDRWAPLRPKPGELVRVGLDLRDGEGLMLMDAEVRHARLVQQPERIVSGLRFRVFVEPPSAALAVARIGRYVAAIQRRLLARVRAKQ